MDFLKIIKSDDKSWEEDLALIFQAFDQLMLPVPDEGEYIHTNDEGYLTFIDFAGCAVRVTEKKIHTCSFPARSDHILQPLVRFNAGNYVVDVLPGVNLPAYDMGDWDMTVWSERMEGQITPLMVLQDYRLYDTNPYNFGVLPIKTAAFPDGYPVLIDPDTVTDRAYHLKPLKQFFARLGIKEGFQPTRQTPLQARLFGDLHHAFAQACQAKNPLTASSLMQAAWKQCHRAQQEGRLIANWHRPLTGYADEKIIKAADVATAYSARITLAI